MDELMKCFRATYHPRVTSREKTVDSVRSEFENGIFKYAPDGNVT